MKHYQKAQLAAFTLIEMVVSIGIIAMVTVLFIANYHSGNKRTDLIMTAQNLAADLHFAQNNTLGLTKYNGLLPPGGWGLSFDTSSSTYTLFADLQDPGVSGYMQYDSSTEGNDRYGARVTQLPDKIKILSLKTFSSPADLGTENTRVNVTFLPPDPQTNIYRVTTAATATALEIKLQETQNNSIKTVRVNFLGLAEVTD